MRAMADIIVIIVDGSIIASIGHAAGGIVPGSFIEATDIRRLQQDAICDSLLRRVCGVVSAVVKALAEHSAKADVREFAGIHRCGSQRRLVV